MKSQQATRGRRGDGRSNRVPITKAPVLEKRSSISKQNESFSLSVADAAWHRNYVRVHVCECACETPKNMLQNSKELPSLVLPRPATAPAPRQLQLTVAAAPHEAQGSQKVPTAAAAFLRLSYNHKLFYVIIIQYTGQVLGLCRGC